MSSRHVLITGGAGFIGTHLSTALLARGDTITAVDNLSAGILPALSTLTTRPNFTLIQHDVTVPLDVTVPVDVVVHLASVIGTDIMAKQPVGTLKTGSLGALNALEFAKQHGARIVLASSSEIYGDPLVYPQREEYRGNADPTALLSCYAEAKRFTEAAAFAYHRQHGLSIGIVRPFNVYGPGTDLTDRRVVSAFITQALAGQALTLNYGGLQTRSFCYVSDFVDGLIALIDSGQQGPINLGASEEITIRALADLIVEIVGSGRVITAPGRIQDDGFARRCPDLTRAHELLGWQPQVGLREGIELTAAWMRAMWDEARA
ncbi:NAD-dependent epimerase/dehydratase family protein [Streptosporangium sp. NPDC020072]|uniref:NAD-dependent epimerase/dehydratase family protein n=1 Tax=Streptosporangium sp. NPDC020072 TaxID=3154788 RepID=UPI00343BF621